jgi:hypothetical protein
MARPRNVNDNAEILSYALLHLEKERDSILAKIEQIRSQLGGKQVVLPASATTEDDGLLKARKPRVLSPAARKRISMAQKKRWAAARKTE